MPDSNDQIPLFRFIKRHKWRIILPLVFSLLYWGVPRFSAHYAYMQQTLYVTSSTIGRDDLNRQIESAREDVLSDSYLGNIVTKYNLYANESGERERIAKLRSSLEVSSENYQLSDDIDVWIWVHQRAQNEASLMDISNDIASRFEAIPDVKVFKHISAPYESSSSTTTVIISSLLLGLLLLVIPLILLWEIPNMFYSQRTHEMVFEPLKADWDEELAIAKGSGSTWKAFDINVRYSVAFISATIQRSPLGGAIEFMKKLSA